MDARHVGPRALAIVAFGLIPVLTGASYRTANFAVEAPTAEAARKIAERAEECRVEFAKAWLGHELSPWKTPCPIRVKLTAGEAGGVTEFGFGGGRVTDQDMFVEGRLDRILASALPHEVTHTIFAEFFGGPMPRWADEGASLLSEDNREIQRHEQIVVDLLRRRGDFPLQKLFTIEEYPRDLMGFYGQGYSISRFLVEMGGRPTFLKFVKDGSSKGWDAATRAHYRLENVRELDRAWRAWHRVTLANRTDAPADDSLARATAEVPSVLRGQSGSEPADAPRQSGRSTRGRFLRR